MILSLVVFSLTFPGSSRLAMPPWRLVRHVLVGWLSISGLLLLFGYGSRYIDYFHRDVLVIWWWIAPLSLTAVHVLLRVAAPAIRELQGDARRVVLAGKNEQGIELAQRLGSDLYANVRVLGFFDDRDEGRLDQGAEYPLLGKLMDLPDYAKRNSVDTIYLSLPMASQARILALLEGLRDTTSSIYFVPDTFVTDLIQGRVDAVGGIPVVAVCETPFTGLNGVIKRGSDVALSLVFLAFLSPLLLTIALGVKATSPGPAIFRQRRYGLNGEEITVYKFRTMRVQEDGAAVTQATKDDPRTTHLGRFLRRYSLDELPQLVNVLQGRMSLVGPRPHAVAHNEMYRKVIKGYMIRHKVRPGITGLAQVNGLRGETRTVEQMEARVRYDLEYLRNWSVGLDLQILAKTALRILNDSKAF